MRKSLALLLSTILILSTVLFTASASAESIFKITPDAGVTAQIQAFTDIKAMFTATPVLADIKAKYVKDFQASVKAIDASIKAGDPKIDEQISFILDNAIKGDLNAGQAKQAIDKGLQWYFYFLTKDLINKQAKPALVAGDAVKAKVELEKAIQIYEGVLQPTVVKRDTKFKTTMQNLLDTVVIPELLKDVENKDVLSYDLHRQMYDKTLIKMFSYATITYADSIPTKAAADQPAAMTEAYFFFMSVYSYLKGGSVTDADYIKNTFASGKVENLDAVKIKQAFVHTLTGKFTEYALKAVEKVEAKDNAGAQVQAMEGNMFLAAQEIFITDKLGAEAYKQAVEQGTLFAKAIAADNVKDAQKYSFNVLQFISKLEGLSFKVGTSKALVNGEEKLVATASYINAKTNRTLVPTRYAELLGAKVIYHAATKTVELQKDGKSIVLTIGKDTVTVNGELSEKKLDQPLVLKPGVTYLPLRAVAELLGYKAFYQKGEVIITL